MTRSGSDPSPASRKVTVAELDNIARTYHTSENVPDKFIEDQLQHYSSKWILDQVGPAGTRVLEFGYGEGIITGILADRGYQTTLLEGSSLLADEARQKVGDRVDVRHCLFEEFTSDPVFDRALASHVLEHVDDPAALLRKIHGWLHPERGRIVIIVPNSESIHRKLAVLMGLQEKLDTLGARDLMVGHQRVYSLASLCEQLTDCGFEIVQTAGFFLKPLPNSMMLNFSPKLIEAMNDIAAEMPKHLMANIGVVARPIT